MQTERGLQFSRFTLLPTLTMVPSMPAGVPPPHRPRPPCQHWCPPLPHPHGHPPPHPPSTRPSMVYPSRYLPIHDLWTMPWMPHRIYSLQRWIPKTTCPRRVLAITTTTTTTARTSTTRAGHGHWHEWDGRTRVASASSVEFCVLLSNIVRWMRQ